MEKKNYMIIEGLKESKRIVIYLGDPVPIEEAHKTIGEDATLYKQHDITEVTAGEYGEIQVVQQRIYHLDPERKDKLFCLPIGSKQTIKLNLEGILKNLLQQIK